MKSTFWLVLIIFMGLSMSASSQIVGGVTEVEGEGLNDIINKFKANLHLLGGDNLK